MSKKSRKRANGEGMLRERSDGRWEARVPTEIDPLTGKQKFKTFYGHSQAEARAKRDEYLTATRTGTYVEPKKVLFGDYLSAWLDRYVKPNIRESTYSLYHSHVKNHIKPELGGIELQKLNTDTLQDFYNKKTGRLSGSAINLMHLLIRGCLDYAVEEKHILYNPDSSKQIKRPRVEAREVKPFNQEELQKFLKAAKGDPFYPMFVLDLHTGLRKGELLALRWKNANLNDGVLHVERSIGRIGKPGGKGTQIVESPPKTKAGVRDIPLPNEIVSLLKAHRAAQIEQKLALGQKHSEDSYIFDNGYGKPVDPRWFLRKLKIILEKAELRNDIRVHTLRHTFGTMLAQARENPKNLQELLGHADIRTTLGTYVHSTLEDKKRAVDKLASLINE
ncbi:Integrase [Acididesulfobacillus acetoxydans]|uniref:Integrase n=1 Tax=Acididesulfobacillus acetoxydans TaxID=1561005 RepID=A0A8S0WQ76_9FIRM|nr:site-specific integrase [Acididesulfobacillus acetoxydans]CAA7602444.1 Integrase [Acididesulfobacillus acetoxydans]CEJ05899.1 Phage integrase, N-terminal SAM-like domain [Acididesulfobacillus acetoxydans]